MAISVYGYFSVGIYVFEADKTKYTVILVAQTAIFKIADVFSCTYGVHGDKLNVFGVDKTEYTISFAVKTGDLLRIVDPGPLERPWTSQFPL